MKPDAILVPRGAEYQAVCQGLESVRAATPRVVAIPAGPIAQASFLKASINPSWKRLWVMGLCGSLKPELGIGCVVVYRACTRSDGVALPCAPVEIEAIQKRLAEPSSVLAFSADRVVTSAIEKRKLALDLNTEVVDMEGFAILEVLRNLEIAVGMVRVVSDDCEHNLPDLTGTIDSQGNLQPLPLAFALLRNPLAGLQLVSGSLRALDALRLTARRLFDLAR